MSAWTSADLAKWRKLAKLASRAIAESHKGRLASGAAMGDLARACRRGAKAAFPSRDRDDWVVLNDFLHRAQDFATGTAGFREENRAQLLRLSGKARVLLGMPLPAADGVPAGEPASPPYYLRD